MVDTYRTIDRVGAVRFHVQFTMAIVHYSSRSGVSDVLKGILPVCSTQNLSIYSSIVKF